MRESRDGTLVLVAVVVLLLSATIIVGGSWAWHRMRARDVEEERAAAERAVAAAPTVAPTIATATAAPTATATASAPSTDALVVAKLRPKFRDCYNAGLRTDPSMAGTMVVRIDVGPGGKPSDVERASGSGLSPAVEACILGAARGATYDASLAGMTMRIPVTFVRVK